MSREIGLTLSGGGSRAIAFHLGCFKTLKNYELLDRVGAISSVSGGSLFAAIYCYSDYDGFEEFEYRVRCLLRNGLVSAGIKKMLVSLPRLIFQRFKIPFSSYGVTDVSNRTHIFSDLLDDHFFSGKKITETNKPNIRLVINSYDLVSNSCFRASHLESGTYKLGVLDNNDLQVSDAVAASAAYPLFLNSLTKKFEFSSGEKEKVMLIDGGIYDNSGISCFAPFRRGINSDLGINSIVALDASHGRFGQKSFPYYFFSRLHYSVGRLMTKHHDQFKKHLFSWKNNGLIDKFAYIYLGQNDERLPYKPDDFIENFDDEEVGTNFTALPEDIIDKLVNRGQQLSKIILSTYGFLK